MRIVIEVMGCIVQAAYSDKPDDVEVIIRDFDDIQDGSEDPFTTDPTLSAMRGPKFSIY